VPGLGTSFGRGGATTFQQDLANSDCIVIMGSNAAECHPVGFQYVMDAREKGAEVIHIDPRYTRTSAMSSRYIRLRAGSDIALLGGVINHILQNGLEFREYVEHYTNASVIIDPRFRDTEDLDGVFSGFDAKEHVYDTRTWSYEDMEVAASAGEREQGGTMGEQSGHGGQSSGLAHGEPPHEDPDLEHPRCVFQLLKKHFSRYTPEVVERITGVPPDQVVWLAETLAKNSGRERTSAFVYAVGWTQHTVGVQYIRAASIIQLLLGNVGRPGGGVMALRGHATIQGSTDIPTLYNILPGYIPMPHVHQDASLKRFLETYSGAAGFWGRMPSYFVSLLKAWWGDAATKDNEFYFSHLPRITGDHSMYPTAMGMRDGTVKGLICAGQNPAVGSANAGLYRRAMAGLEWLVVRDFVESETAAFWYDSQEIERGELRTEDIPTEVFFLPAATHTEKDGSFTNTQRLVQWHHKAVEPRGDCRSSCGSTTTWGASFGRSSPARRTRATAASSTWPGPIRPRGRSTSRAPRRCWRRSTASPGTGSRWAPTPSSRTTAAPAAAAGSTAASTPAGPTWRPAASRGRSSRSSRPNGAGRGRRTAASSTTARRPTVTASRGRSASGTCGGTRARASGPATTCPTSWSTCIRITSHPRARPPRRLFAATSRS